MKADNVNEIEYSPHLKIVPLVAIYVDDVNHKYFVVNILSEVIVRSQYYQHGINYYINNNIEILLLVKIEVKGEGEGEEKGKGLRNFPIVIIVIS